MLKVVTSENALYSLIYYLHNVCLASDTPLYATYLSECLATADLELPAECRGHQYEKHGRPVGYHGHPAERLAVECGRNYLGLALKQCVISYTNFHSESMVNTMYVSHYSVN